MITRALVVSLLIAWPALARADSTEMHIEVTDVTIYGEGYWELVDHVNGGEAWKNASDDVRKLVQIVFLPGEPGGCAPYGDAEDVTSEYAFEEDTYVWEGMKDGATVTAVCTEAGGNNYRVEAMLFGGGTLLWGFYDDLNGMVHSYISSVRRANGAAEEYVAIERVREPVGPYVVPPRRAWFWPNTLSAGAVQRSDGEVSAWGAGATIGRRPWHPERHLAIGYDASVTAASGWISGAASVRPGAWIGTGVRNRSQRRKGALADVYLSLGVDWTTGEKAPATGAAVTFGGGASVTLIGPAHTDLGMGLDANLEVLADPSGLHSHSEGLALLSGNHTSSMMRLGFRHVTDEATGDVWWFTIGWLDTRNDR